MSKPWRITEKVIAIFLIIWGAGFLCVEIYGMWEILQWNQMGWRDISWSKFINNYQLEILLDLLIIFSGIMLLIRKRVGWICAVSVTLFTPFDSLIQLYLVHIFERDIVYLLLVLFIIFWTIFILLISKPIRLNYFSGKVAWKSVAIIFIVLLTDRFMFHMDNEMARKYKVESKKMSDELDSATEHFEYIDSTK
jgi:hypothetical protein